MSSREGFWRVAYEGSEGYGFALLVFDTNEIYGCDVAGGRYRGTYTIDGNGNLHLDVKVSASEPLMLVQGIVLHPGQEFRITGILPRDSGDVTRMAIRTVSGEIIALFQRIDRLPG